MNFDAVRPNLYKVYWVGVVAMSAYAVVQGVGTPPLLFILGVAVGGFALLPAYLWCSGKVDGLPLFPLFALTHVWTFAMPLIMQNRAVTRYQPDAQAMAALTVIAFLGVGTLAWLWAMGGKRPQLKPAYWGFALRGNNWAFLLGLLVSLSIFLAIRTGLLSSMLRDTTEGIYSIFQSVAMSLMVLCVTVLSYRAGQHELRGFGFVGFLVVFVLTLMALGLGLILNSPLAAILVSIGVYTISRGRVPFVALGIAFVVFSLLHVGKWPMREKYLMRGLKPIPVENMPDRYVEWFGYGIEGLPGALAGEKYSRKRHQTLVERGSLLQMLLLVQDRTPEFRSYLGGETYTIIPELLVPRFLNPKKLRAHQGTYILSMYYGLQDQKATLKTTIAFGLLAESYANFGLLGVLGLAIILGCLYGFGARWSMHAPVTSVRGLFALLLLASTVAVEHTAGVFVTTLFQGTIVLLGMALIAMRPQPTAPARTRLPATAMPPQRRELLTAGSAP
jgi:hypothetical protein